MDPQHVEQGDDDGRDEQPRIRLDQDAFNLVKLRHPAPRRRALLLEALVERALDLELEEAGRFQLDAERQPVDGRVERVHVRVQEPEVVGEEDREVGLLVVKGLGSFTSDVDVCGRMAVSGADH